MQVLVRIRGNRAFALLLTLLLVAAAMVFSGARSAQADNCVVNDSGDAHALNAATACLTAGATVTLRSAIEHFNSIGGTNVITFSIPAGSQITTTNGLINVSGQDLTITAGTTPGSIILDGNNGGGGFKVASGTSLTFSGLTLQHTATNGNGGAVDNSGALVISDSSLNDNTTDANGGAIENRGGSITMTDSVIANNTVTGADDIGAGIRSFGAATVNLTRVTVSGNRLTGADSTGGGVQINGAGTYNFVNVTISGNSATGIGGGVLVENGAQLHATNITVANNSASAGGGFDVDQQSIAFVTNTIASGNTPDNCHGSGGITSSQGHSLELGNSCAFAQASDIHADPQLGALALNPPGFLKTQSLADTSPAVDKGDTTACPATDERGVQRKLDGACDIGAFELIAAAVSASPSPPGLPRSGSVPGGVAGSSSGPWVEIGVALALAGAGLLAMTRIRRRPAR